MLRTKGKHVIILILFLLASLSVYQLHYGGGIKTHFAWPSSLSLEALHQNGTNATEYYRSFNSTLLELVPSYTEVIMHSDSQNKDIPRLDCLSVSNDRYTYLKPQSQNIKENLLPKYLFALNLHQSIEVLPTLMGSIVRAVQVLGPGNCALSIVEGRSTDGTFEVLAGLKDTLKSLGLEYFFETSDIDPKNDRIQSLANLRNLALNPFISQADQFSDDSTIIFINDVVLCPDDILELIHQRKHQGADMTCAMDWTYLATDPTFYDVWIARGMTGDTFFNIPEDGNWNSAWNLFWNDPDSRNKLMQGVPFQVFSCWNGITAFTAKPLLQRKIEFRPSSDKECFQGEPKLFCKDFWYHGFGKIAVVPSANVGYTISDTQRLKNLKGYVSKWTSAENDNAMISWISEPPALVKCIPKGYDNQPFVPWNEGLKIQDVPVVL